MIADLCQIDIRILEGSIHADNHFDDDGKAIFPFIQGGEVGGKLFGNHRENHARGVNRGGIMPRMFVNGCSIFNERIYIRHSNQDLDLLSRQCLSYSNLIQVERIIIVDGCP